jgi:hypothetical protein
VNQLRVSAENRPSTVSATGSAALGCWLGLTR